MKTLSILLPILTIIINIFGIISWHKFWFSKED